MSTGHCPSTTSLPHYHHHHHHHEPGLRKSWTLSYHYPGDLDGCEDSGIWRPPSDEGFWRSPRLVDRENAPEQTRRHEGPLDRESTRRRNLNLESRSAQPPIEAADGDRSSTDTSSSSQDDDSSSSDEDKLKRLSWRQRLKHVTWAWFTLTMATGGIANVLHHVPYRFSGLYTIGVIFFLLNIVFYIGIWAMMIMRFTFYPWTFRASLTHPTESLFVPAFAVSFGTILINIVEYGTGRVGDWLNHGVLVLFWLDAAVAVVLSIAIYLILWSTLTFTIARMTPIWIFPAYPLLIIGPHAANLSQQALSPHQAIRVIVGGFTIQGIGFLVSLTIYSAFVYRLMTQKLPAEPLRPGMFVSVGPSAFTVSGTLGMAKNLQHVIAATPTSTFLEVPGTLAAQVLRLVATWMSLWLWGLAWWFFFVSLVSNIDCLRDEHRMPFAMTWFSFIFPQTALTTATFAVAEAFDIAAVRIIGCVMTCLLIAVWFLVVGFMIRAVVQKQILWPERGEDKNEGGFKAREGETVVVPAEIGREEGLGHSAALAEENRDFDAAEKSV
ncbi:Malic acid transport protein [Exophiala dermatitidis]